MGGVLFEYGTAAHLALLTVAPLFLYVACGPSMHAMALLGLSLLAALWVVMNPSPREGEWPRDARHRIGWELAHDPFLTFSVLALVLAFVRTVNTGVGVGYDAASGLWRMNGPAVSLLPGSVSGCGWVPLAGLFGLVIVTLGVRHALDSRARYAYLLMTGVLAAVAVIVWRLLAVSGLTVMALSPSSQGPISPGVLLGVYFLVATAAWVGSWDFDSAFVELLATVSVAVLLTGLIVTSPAIAFIAFGAIALTIVAVGVAVTVGRRPPFEWFRTSLFLAIMLVPIGFIVMGGLPTVSLWPILTDEFLAIRRASLDVAVVAWKHSSQLGVGLGAFSQALRFFATPETWRVLTDFQVAVPCGWVQFVFERGMLGAVMFLAGVGILLRDGILQYLRSGVDWSYAARNLLGPLVLLGVTLVQFTDASHAQLDALIPVGATLALTAAAFQFSKEGENG